MTLLDRPELIVRHNEGLVLFGVVRADHQIVHDEVVKGVCSFVNAFVNFLMSSGPRIETVSVRFLSHILGES